MSQPRVSSVTVSVPAPGLVRPSTRNGEWVMDLDMAEVARELVQPTTINGPYGDGHVELVFRDPPDDWSAQSVLELLASVVG